MTSALRRGLLVIATTIYGYRLDNSNQYYAQLKGNFNAAGYSITWGISPLKTGMVQCWGNDNCYLQW